MTRLRLMTLVVALGGCSVVTDLSGLSDGTGSGTGNGGDGGTDAATLDAPSGTGDAGTATDGASGDGASTNGTFVLSVDSPSIMLDPAEQNAKLTVHVARAAGFKVPIAISINGLPSSVVASALTLPSGTDSGDISLGAAPAATATTAAVTVLGVAASDTAQVSLPVFVTGEIAGFDKNGAFVVPSPCPPTLGVIAWGAGGAGGGVNSGFGGSFGGGTGGAGGYAGGRIAMTAGESLDVLVGLGGAITGQGGGSGGGYSAISRGTTLLLLAGGGGGGGAGYAETNSQSGTRGGAGGGVSGQKGDGLAGTSIAGGAADVCGAAKCDGKVPTAGASRLGGNGGGQSTQGLTAGGAPGGGSAYSGGGAGGGGGGGFFGGGGGGYRLYNPLYILAHGGGGGGGSGFGAVGVTPLGGALLVAGVGPTPALSSDPRYRTGVAIGGAGADANPHTPATAGGHGRVAVVIAK